jgi:transposase-like protein
VSSSAPGMTNPIQAATRLTQGEIISYTVWLYFRFPLGLRHVDEILAARGITVSHETVRQ